MNLLRLLVAFSALWVCLLFSGCQMMSGGSPGSSLGRLTPFNGPPKQSEPEILEEGADSPEIDLNSEELSQRAPANKQDRNYMIGQTEERKQQLSLPVTESRPALTDDPVQIPEFSEAG